MEELAKKVSYLKGFADGLDINEKTDEGKLLKKIIEALEDISDAICDLAQDHDELCEQVDAIDEDLGELEDEIYGDDDDCDCGCCDDDMECFEIECPNCKETICIDESFFDGDDDKPIICPNCNKEIELDFSCDCDCGDDGCGCDGDSGCGCEE